MKKFYRWAADIAFLAGLGLISLAAFCVSTGVGLLVAGTCCAAVGVLMRLGGDG